MLFHENCTLLDPPVSASMIILKHVLLGMFSLLQPFKDEWDLSVFLEHHDVQAWICEVLSPAPRNNKFLLNANENIWLVQSKHIGWWREISSCSLKLFHHLASEIWRFSTLTLQPKFSTNQETYSIKSSTLLQQQKPNIYQFWGVMRNNFESCEFFEWNLLAHFTSVSSG